ncbi:MAG: phytanoyl-CoA dioxygenase family protein, partial [Sphingomonas sp.]
ASSPALGWHQDWWCWDHPISARTAPAQIALLCYLDLTSTHNGALRLLPGSHRSRLPLHTLLPDLSETPLSEDHAAMCDQPGQRSFIAASGDAIAIDYRLLHGTHANRTAAPRDALLLSFVPDWAGLPKEIRGHLISHHALPSRHEGEDSRACGYAGLLPTYSGPRKDLPLRRRPPQS